MDKDTRTRRRTRLVWAAITRLSAGNRIAHLRDIAQMTGVPSTSLVLYHIHKLERSGYVRACPARLVKTSRIRRVSAGWQAVVPFITEFRIIADQAA